MSREKTRDLDLSIQEDHPRVRLVYNPKGTAPAGINSALEHAAGANVVRVDGHCEVAPDYVRRCVEHLENEGVTVVGGPLETVGQTTLARVIATAMSTPFGVGDSNFRTTHGRTMLVDTVAFPAYRRETLENAGPFDEELVRNQDDEYNYRLRKMGAKILLAPDVRCRYYSRSSIRSLARQYFQYGYWKVRVLQKHPLQMRPRQFAPPLFVLSLLVGLALAPFFPAALYAWLALLGTYALANFTASALTARKGGWRHLPLLSVVFAVLHVSYGLGFLVGLVRFANRWGKPRSVATP
jgi:hypothetical protein